MCSTECEVTSLTDTLMCTIRVKEVKKCMEDGKTITATLGSSGVRIRLYFGSRKKEWLSFFVSAPENQTYLFHSIDVTMNNGALQLSKRSFASLPRVFDGYFECGHFEYLSFATLSNVGELYVDFRVNFERKEETSLPLKPCSDPSLHSDLLELLRDGEKSDITLILGNSRIPVHKAIL